ncbi:MAG TPA: CRISPR-associated protein Cas4 [Armatimonadota bacterium]|jgi:CRISPR-associated exonuclease Cas4
MRHIGRLDEVLISAIEHYSYCPRQCALIHVERVFDENVFTLRGQQAHARVSEATTTMEGDVRMERALPVWSESQGLFGVADLVEFHPNGAVIPVEYKHGPRRPSRHVDLQLCAYAVCLEEILGVSVAKGAVFSIKSKRRREVTFTQDLRGRMNQTVEAIRAVLAQGSMPPPVDDARCPTCSLVEACIPAALVAAAKPRDVFSIPKEEAHDAA